MSNTEGDPRHLETLDRDLARFSNVELAALYVSRPMVSTGIALIFVVMAGLAAALFFGQANNSIIVIVAACLGAYMALNIGANDVANNMGPAVGANALTMGGAIAIAVVFESAGALLAGGDVVSTIAKGIIAPESMGTADTFIWAMMAALLSAALWINLATWVGAPVSTTHSVVGGVMGAGIAAVGFGAVNWPTMGQIAASWVISPVLGGAVAALFLALIKSRIIYRDDKIAAARTWVPVLVGIMAGTFSSYLALKGLSKVFKVELHTALLIGLAIGVLTWAVMIPLIRKQSEGLENRNKSLKVLFGIPLIVSAALLSFAHGANDVANAVGPLAAIVHRQLYRSGQHPDVGDGHGGLWHLVRSVPVRSQADPHGRWPNYQAEPDARLLRGAVGGDHSDRGKLAGPAGQLDPHRGGWCIRRRILPRMGRRTAHPQGETGNARPSPLCARGTPPPQAGAPVTFHDHHCRLGHHRACRRDTVCGDLLWHPDRGRIGPHWARHGKGDSPPVPRPKCKTWTILPVCND